MASLQIWVTAGRLVWSWAQGPLNVAWTSASAGPDRASAPVYHDWALVGECTGGPGPIERASWPNSAMALLGPLVKILQILSEAPRLNVIRFHVLFRRQAGWNGPPATQMPWWGDTKLTESLRTFMSPDCGNLAFLQIYLFVHKNSLWIHLEPWVTEISYEIYRSHIIVISRSHVI